MSNCFATFHDAVSRNIHRPGIIDLMNWLDGTDFYLAPASTRFHGAHEGGLVEHSLHVHARLHQLDAGFNAALSSESMAICALFHDLCKIGCYKVSTRNVKNDNTGQWEKVPFYNREEEFPFGGHGSKSVYLVQSFIKLRPEEAAAINCHMGPWDRQDYGNPGEVFEQNRLAWLLHVADEAATYLDDK